METVAFGDRVDADTTAHLLAMLLAELETQAERAREVLGRGTPRQLIRFSRQEVADQIRHVQQVLSAVEERTQAGSQHFARIVRIRERTTLLRRSADDTDAVERVIVANADQMLIIIAAANPEPRVRLVDRYLVAAYDAGIAPLVCVTKTDLADPAPFLANFAGLDLPVFLSRSDDMPLDAISDRLVGHRIVDARLAVVELGFGGRGLAGAEPETLVNRFSRLGERAAPGRSSDSRAHRG